MAVSGNRIFRAAASIILSVVALAVASVHDPGPARVIKDMNLMVGDETWSSSRGFAEVEGYTLFTASTHSTGFDLCRTDGTDAGTVPVKDIFPGSGSGINVFASARVGETVRIQGLFDAGGHPDSGQSAIVADKPMRAVQDLASNVRALGLPFGVEVSLTAKLDAAAEASLDRMPSRS